MGRTLSERLTLYACDLPGHGMSDGWDGEVDLHDRSTDAVRLLLDAPHDVIGHSFGAIVALRLAIERPEMVRSLCLLEPVLFAVAGLDAPWVLEQHNAEAEPYLDALSKGDTELAARLFNRIWGDGRSWDAIRQRTRGYITDRIHLISAQDQALYDDAAHLLDPQRLSRLCMPVLLIRGDESPPIASVINEGLMHRIPSARQAIVRGAGHMLPVTHAPQVGALIMKLLEETEE